MGGDPQRESCTLGAEITTYTILVVPYYKSIVNPGKLEHGFRMINAGIPYTLP